MADLHSQGVDKAPTTARKRQKKPEAAKQAVPVVKNKINSAEAQPNLSNTPVHGDDTPLKLEHLSDDGQKALQ